MSGQVKRRDIKRSDGYARNFLSAQWAMQATDKAVKEVERRKEIERRNGVENLKKQGILPIPLKARL